MTIQTEGGRWWDRSPSAYAAMSTTTKAIAMNGGAILKARLDILEWATACFGSSVQAAIQRLDATPPLPVATEATC